MNGVKALIVSTIAQEKFFMKMLVDGVILFGFPRIRHGRMPLLEAKCCPENSTSFDIRKGVLPDNASQILRPLYLAGYGGNLWA